MKYLINKKHKNNNKNARTNIFVIQVNIAYSFLALPICFSLTSVSNTKEFAIWGEYLLELR